MSAPVVTTMTCHDFAESLDMRQAILTKYLAPTNTKGARVKAWCAGKTITRAWDYASGAAANHEGIAMYLALKLDWPMNFVGGSLPDGTGYCFVQVERGDRE